MTNAKLWYNKSVFKDWQNSDKGNCRVVRSMNYIIEPRKLEKQEYGKSRKLWEEIFQEDTKKFLDYYYSVKTLENEIYVIEEDNKIVSMLHLNPYQIRIGNEVYQTHYIVAVATDEKYRKRGYMASLLNHAMKVMKDRGEPFTFLMPAAEAIYKPFGFEFIYEQKRGTVSGKVSDDKKLKFVLAKKEDCQEIANFANVFLKEYDVVTWRNASYYETLLQEQASENGGILLAKEGDKIAGVFCFAKSTKEHIEIREPLFERKEILEHAVYLLAGNETQEVFCVGYGKKTKPMIMAKVLQSDFEKDLKNLKVFLNEVV